MRWLIDWLWEGDFVAGANVPPRVAILSGAICVILFVMIPLLAALGVFR